MDDHEHRLRKRGTIALIGFLLVAGFFLITEHTAHFLGALPYLILLACPLMHLFMHRGHGDQMHRHAHGPIDPQIGPPAYPDERAGREPR